MDTAQARHETAALNLASAQQPGYRRTHLSQSAFESALLAARKTPDSEAPAAAPPGDVIDFRMGSIEQTGRSLDVALQGDGFFTIEGPRGPLYTRSGRFHVNETGELITVDGLPVQGNGATIRLPPGTSTESLQISSDGRLLTGDAPVGQLQIVRFAEPTQLQRAGKSLFAAPEGVYPEPSDATVAQGMLEGSNVSAVSELIELIAASRQYEAASQAMRSITQATQQNINGRGGN